jgi:serralysin
MKKTLLLLMLMTINFFAFSQIVCRDIVIDDSFDTPPSLALLRSNAWQPGDNLKVKFLDGDNYVREKVKKYAVEWSTCSSIKLTFVESGYGDIRISFTQGMGSWSIMGTESKVWSINMSNGQAYKGTDGPTMNFGWFNHNTAESDFKGTTLHEFGHALGAIHEHQHPENGIEWNKPVVYAYYLNPPNNWSPAKVDQNIFQKYSVSQTFKASYDKNSIMHYPIPKEHTLNNYAVGMNHELSDLDKKYMSEVYPDPFIDRVHFKSITAAENGVIYAVDYEGKMRWYKYTGTPGNHKWAEGSGNVISRGWNSFRYIVAGKNGAIFGVALNGDMYWYQYLGAAGEEKWEKGSSTKISGGWNSFVEVMCGADNNLFALSANGDMIWYKYTGQKGEHSWAEGSRSVIGGGWNSYKKIFVDKSNQIFGVTTTGDLILYTYTGTNGAAQFSKNSKKKISEGWESFHNALSGDAGTIFAVTQKGEMLYYGLSKSGDNFVWTSGTGDVIGKGW